MKYLLKTVNFNQLKSDVIASIVVTLIAIPLCLGIALASGTPILSGLIAGIIGGIVIGLLSRSQVSVSGPAAGMIGVVIAGISQLGSFEAFLLATFFAGIIQLCIGLFRAGFVADYIPANVIQGLLCAIGIVIIMKQLPFAFGYFPQSDAVAESLKQSQEAFLMNPLEHLSRNFDFGATLISMLSLGILIIWDKTPFAKFKLLPAALAVLLLSVFMNVIYGCFFPSLYLFELSHLVNLPSIDSLETVKNLMTWTDFSLLSNPQIYVYALIIAAIASLETLVNLEAGGQTKMTSIFHGMLGHEKVVNMSDVIQGMLKEKGVDIAKAIYDVKTGTVDFLHNPEN